MIGGIFMLLKKSKRQFGSVIINEVKQMVSDGKTQREIAEYFGLKDKLVIKQLLIRERRKENRIALGIIPIAKGRPRKNDITSDQHKDNEIKRLKMEIELLHSFLQINGRK
jgi:hypothetical protein